MYFVKIFCGNRGFVLIAVVDKIWAFGVVDNEDIFHNDRVVAVGFGMCVLCILLNHLQGWKEKEVIKVSRLTKQCTA